MLERLAVDGINALTFEIDCRWFLVDVKFLTLGVGKMWRVGVILRGKKDQSYATYMHTKTV
jgi:hypothetical protein